MSVLNSDWFKIAAVILALLAAVGLKLTVSSSEIQEVQTSLEIHEEAQRAEERETRDRLTRLETILERVDENVKRLLSQ